MNKCLLRGQTSRGMEPDSTLFRGAWRGRGPTHYWPNCRHLPVRIAAYRNSIASSDSSAVRRTSERVLTGGTGKRHRKGNLQRLRRLTVGALVSFGSFTYLGATQAAATGIAHPPDDGAYYLALGASGSLGVQPTLGHPKGQPTNSGYANDLLALERSRWSGLRLAPTWMSRRDNRILSHGRRPIADR